MKENVIRWGSQALIVCLALLITWLLPEDKRVQIIAPIVTGAVMLLFANLLRRPSVGIEDLGETVGFRFSQRDSELRCYVSGVMVNKSATGEGELRELVLTISTRAGDCLRVPAEQREYRFRPNSRFPEDILHFRRRIENLDITATSAEICGRQAEIRLRVVGQSTRRRNVTMANEPS